MAGDDSLGRYREKRDFTATGEPRGGGTAGGEQGDDGGSPRRSGKGRGAETTAGRRATHGRDATGGRRPEGEGETESRRGPDLADGASGSLSYVVQIHDARRMHFDFRLEVGGVLKSWAVPKGPSTDPRDKRLAVPTEDHPMEYRGYEGVIGGGQYGAGTVIVWDTGTYQPLGKNGEATDADSFAKALAAGHASFWLDGPKLQGGYTLTRFRGGEGTGHEDDGEEAWLLVKRADRKADRHGTHTPDPRRARSAQSGRTLNQVAQEDGEQDSAHHMINTRNGGGKDRKGEATKSSAKARATGRARAGTATARGGGT
ncbi:DNA polymerase ligase N-terminal domain-containing protein [Streptomyces fuscigenes]|uniref:DNA polymerase ligase N-terminal domain-containing protein n=1 Tax=Streptomyces fuscigenes TaxID=1528880 RepID=UPI0035579ABB